MIGTNNTTVYRPEYQFLMPYLHNWSLADMLQQHSSSFLYICYVCCKNIKTHDTKSNAIGLSFNFANGVQNLCLT